MILTALARLSKMPSCDRSIGDSQPACDIPGKPLNHQVHQQRYYD